MKTRKLTRKEFFQVTLGRLIIYALVLAEMAGFDPAVNALLRAKIRLDRWRLGL